MIFLVLIIAAVVLFVLGILSSKLHEYFENAISFILCVAFCLAFFVCIFTLVAGATTAVINTFEFDGKKAAADEEYKSLLIKAEMSEYAKIEYIDEIQSWNMMLAKQKEYNKNKWIGVLYPDYYVDCDLIEINSIE